LYLRLFLDALGKLPRREEPLYRGVPADLTKQYPKGATANTANPGAWLLVKKIGEGGMGQVWRARRADGLYEALAAIKLLRGDLAAGGLAGRFARERSLLARLSHPAIARLLDAGVEGGQAYLVLELVPGRTLSVHVRALVPTVAGRVKLLLRIAEAVDHAHAQLIVHRDLKPSNVIVTESGDAKLLDFGIAALRPHAPDRPRPHGRLRGARAGDGCGGDHHHRRLFARRDAV
jgi:serine/threonine protein kinase